MHFFPHWKETLEPEKKLAVFCTGPAIRSVVSNFISEIFGTFVLMFGILCIVAECDKLNNGLAPFIVGVLVWAIGLSLGGTTGYAINPARDLAPRIAHAILPIHGKGTSDWQYAWIPVLGPILGALLGAFVYHSYFKFCSLA
jgi:glycerol uptake facilitator protein